MQPTLLLVRRPIDLSPRGHVRRTGRQARRHHAAIGLVFGRRFPDRLASTHQARADSPDCTTKGAEPP